VIKLKIGTTSILNMTLLLYDRITNCLPKTNYFTTLALIHNFIHSFPEQYDWHTCYVITDIALPLFFYQCSFLSIKKVVFNSTPKSNVQKLFLPFEAFYATFKESHIAKMQGM